MLVYEFEMVGGDEITVKLPRHLHQDSGYHNRAVGMLRGVGIPAKHTDFKKVTVNGHVNCRTHYDHQDITSYMIAGTMNADNGTERPVEVIVLDKEYYE